MKRDFLVPTCTRIAVLCCIASACSSLSAQSLVHLWAFEEPLGQDTTTFADSSGNMQTGTGYASIVSGRWGNAAKMLPGSDPLTSGIGDGGEYIDPTPADSPLPTGANDSWSINTWALFESGHAPGNLEYLAGFGINDEESNDNYHKARSILSFNGFHFWGASVDLNSGVAMTDDDQWHMYTVTYDGDSTELTMYYDGVRVAHTNYGGSTPFADAPAEIHVGNPSNWNDSKEEFDGTVDEFGIWNGALGPGQIGGLFQSNNTSATQFLEPTVEVNRDTGTVLLQNLTDSALTDVVGLRILSDAGSLATGEWIPITGNLDNGNGTQPVDDGPWGIDVQTAYELSESDQNGSASSIAAGQTIDLGAIWTKSIYEDLRVEVLTDDGTTQGTLDVLLSYTGDSYERSDLDANGILDLNDWEIFSSTGYADLSGLSQIELALSGDLDGDGDNDRQDFHLFRADYIAANGLAAFQALGNATTVPEPATLVLAGLAAVVGLAARRRR